MILSAFPWSFHNDKNQDIWRMTNIQHFHYGILQRFCNVTIFLICNTGWTFECIWIHIFRNLCAITDSFFLQIYSSEVFMKECMRSAHTQTLTHTLRNKCMLFACCHWVHRHCCPINDEQPFIKNSNKKKSKQINLWWPRIQTKET